MKFQRRVAAILNITLLFVISAPPEVALADSVRNSQWHLRSLKVADTRSITTGAGIVVAVLDTGIYPHPDIKRNLLAGSDQAVGGHGNGKTDAVGHGTRMAALIAGHGRGAENGVQGIAPSAKILPVTISKTGREIDSSVMAKGVKWATDKHARVINISATAGPGFELADAVAAATKADIVVVAGAGNASSSVIVDFPAAFDGVLAVGATGKNGKHSSISVKGSKIQICAPGVDIMSAEPKGKYGFGSGTSDSTAIVSGAAALVRAKFPDLSAKEVIHRLTATADDIGPPGRDDECGFGRLNIVKALTAEVAPLEGSTAAPTNPVTSAPVESSSPAPVPTSAAAPGAEPKSGSGLLLFGGLTGLVLAGALGAILAIRRRRRA